MFWKKRIYADAAAATPVSARSKRELVRLLGLYGNAGGIHQEGVAAKKELEAARASVARSIGAHPDEIVFTSSGTEANNLAIQGVLRPMLLLQTPLHAVTCAVEHQSVLQPLRALQREELELSEVGVDEEGLVFPNAITTAVRPDTVFVSVQLVNSEIGTVQPVRDIAKEIRRVRSTRGSEDDLPIYFHTDASQAPLWLSLDVEKLGVDLMTLDAQKILGPKGVGALYIRRGTPIEALLHGGGQEMGLRGGTENVPLAGAFAVALADAKRGVEKRAKKTATVRDHLAAEILKLLPDAVVNGPALAGKKRVANSVNVSVPGLDAEMAVVSLDVLGVAASTRSACSAGEPEPSHVIKAIGVPAEMAGTAIRLTLLPSATKSDARRIAVALKETADRYRRT